jgi:hypothetical protein
MNMNGIYPLEAKGHPNETIDNPLETNEVPP